MIRIEGERSEAHDPKLKLPIVVQGNADENALAMIDARVAEQNKAMLRNLQNNLQSVTRAREAAERLVSSDETGSLRAEMAETKAKLGKACADIAALTTRVDAQDAKITALVVALTKVTRDANVTRDVTAAVSRDVTRDANARSAADRARAYRERQKAAAKP